MDSILDTYTLWCKKAVEDPDLIPQLKSYDDAQKEDAFYRALAFGTGGLRGVIGAGTNRMNVYTVGAASQGLANFVKSTYPENLWRIAVSYDSRIKSTLFARKAAEVFAANGIQVFIYPELMPTPCLSYAVRQMSCGGGVMVTASHNPAKYNGYKVYGPDGCQITTEAANAIYKEIEKIDLFANVKSMNFDAAIAEGQIQWMPSHVYDHFTQEVLDQSVLYGDPIDRNISIVYSPLNGTGLKPVTHALKAAGFTNVTVVPEQQLPDGNFSTCPYPNPEIREAMEKGIALAAQKNAYLLIVTDPDCDRVGIAVRDPASSDYQLITGNEVGVLLLDFICNQRIRHGKMPENPVAIKTIVTTDMAQKVADKYGVQLRNVLTGFKFIGEQISLLEQANRQKDYIFGFEESYGYLSGSYVRDKDAVNSSFLICEMFAYYHTRGISLLDKLQDLYREHGYYLNTLHSYTFEGAAGYLKMQAIMKAFRDGSRNGDSRLKSVQDYSCGLDGLPKSDVMKFCLADGSSFVIRPSGTEPKLKIYITISSENRKSASVDEENLIHCLEGLLKS